MKYLFNTEKLNKVLSDFYKSTNIAITLYDANENLVATSSIFSGYCSYVRSREDCVRCCDNSNSLHMKEVAKTKKTVSYTCHAGLMETITPIIYEGVIIAYIQIGQYKDNEIFYSSPDTVLQVANKYDFDGEKLLSLHSQLQTISRDKLQSLSNILEILIKYLLSENLIYHNRSFLSVKIEKYIQEHLLEKIYIEDLCKIFFISKNMLYHLFKTEFNCTVNNYILNERIKLSQEILKNKPEKSITEIALDCGFSDYNYFIRAFKKNLGITPLQYRKNIK